MKIDKKENSSNVISKIQMLLIKYSSMKNTNFYKEIHDILFSNHLYLLIFFVITKC